MDDNSLEQALAAIECQADTAVRSLTTALKAAKRAKGAAATGQLRELRQALEDSVRLAEQAASAAVDTRAGWTFDEVDHFTSGGYAAEVLALAADEGVQAFESDDRILSYPAIVQVSPADTSVMIDRRKDRRTRPSVLVQTLKALQSRPPKFKADTFLEALAAAYDLVVASKARPGAVVRLVDLYGALTMLPGSRREYTRQEFARDLYLLDQSGVTATRDGRILHLPASALTRSGGVLTTVTRNGQEKLYAGISFEPGTPRVTGDGTGQ